MDDIQLLLNRAYFYLKFRPRTKKEVRDYLYKKIKSRYWSQDDAEKVIKILEGEGLLNDEEFTRWFVEQRNILKPKSVFALKQELIRFGVSKDLIERYFETNELNEEKLAEEALSKRWRIFLDLDKKKRFEKAASFLARRGFSFEVIKKTISKMENEV